MVINMIQFKENCLQLIDNVHSLNKEIIITKNGKPWAKLVSMDNDTSQPFVGSLPGVGRTVGDLLAPFADEWVCD